MKKENYKLLRETVTYEVATLISSLAVYFITAITMLRINEDNTGLVLLPLTTFVCVVYNALAKDLAQMKLYKVIIAATDYACESMDDML